MRLFSRPKAGNLLDWALNYGERGWPVIPLIPRAKRPLTNSGLLDASANRHQIREWWARWPEANIGIRTGVAFDVLDIDGPAGQDALRDRYPGSRATGPVSLTGRGEHWLYLPSGTANRAGLLDKVDWRGTNGYIVAPPSTHPEGHLYAWHPEHGPDRELPLVPDWLEPLLTPYVERPAEEARLRLNEYRPVTIVSIAEAMEYRLYYGGGGRYNIHCPFGTHSDTDPSLVLYPDNDSFYCFGCGAWGDIVALQEGRPRYKDV